MPVEFTSRGYDTTPAKPYGEKAWSGAHSDTPIGSARYGVFKASDWKVSIVAGATRTVSIAPGAGHGCGVTDVTFENETLQFPPSASGTRWDTVAVRRDWTPTAGESKFVIIPGGSTKAVSGARLSAQGEIDDQPIALVPIIENQTQPGEIVDIRCWASNGGVYAKDVLACQYLGQLGAMVTVGYEQYQYILGDNDSPAWVNVGGVMRGPVPLSFDAATYRQQGTWMKSAVKDAAVSRIGRRVELQGGLANEVAIHYDKRDINKPLTEYTLATVPPEFAPKTPSDMLTPLLVNAYQCDVRVTPGGEIKISFKTGVGSVSNKVAAGDMVFMLGGLGWYV